LKVSKSKAMLKSTTSKYKTLNVKMSGNNDSFKCTDMTHLYIRYGEDANLISQHAFRPVLIHTTNHSKNIILRANGIKQVPCYSATNLYSNLLKSS